MFFTYTALVNKIRKIKFTRRKALTAFLPSVWNIFEWFYDISLALVIVCLKTSPDLNGDRWFRWWFGAIRRQANTHANVFPVPCRHMASLGYNLFSHLSDRRYKKLLGIRVLKFTKLITKNTMILWEHSAVLCIWPVFNVTCSLKFCVFTVTIYFTIFNPNSHLVIKSCH